MFEVAARSKVPVAASRVGSPKGFEIEGRFYTYSWLNFALRMAFVEKHIDLSEAVVVEIGSGSGKQAHILKAAYPNATIILFDIAPQVYVANQYLRAALPGEVVGFAEARSITSFDQIQRGKITIFGAWKAPLLQGQKFDLLWNAASFQEMEPDVVANYLRLSEGARQVYLMQTMGGQSQASVAGAQGVLEKTTIETYAEAMPTRKLIDRQPATLALPQQPLSWVYEDTFWS